MTRRDARRRFPATSGGLATPALAGCLGGATGDGHECPTVEDVVQVTVTAT
ncbi:hypothetical protein [Halorubrum tebenquichense]|uniref:hypothetical protein n=1 Tax=Halorubrum tebenquichense TaxID=119434 RepID=UPI0013910A55|nr:hypothetical protein [Halorubrum tebenquichense]